MESPTKRGATSVIFNWLDGISITTHSNLTPMRNKCRFILPFAVVCLAAAGCSKDSGSAVPSTPAPQPSLSLMPDVAEAPAPPPEAPPVPGSAQATAPAAAVGAESQGDGSENLVGSDGKALTGMKLLQMAVDTYRQNTAEGGNDFQPWPPLTSLNQLVQFRILKKLPEAPPGTKYEFNPKTGRVTEVKL